MKVVSTRYFTNDVRLVLLGKTGRKWTRAVVLTTPIRVINVDKKAASKFQECPASVSKMKKAIKEYASWTYSEGLPKTLTNFLKGA